MNKEQQELLDEAYENYCKEYENGTHLIGTGLLWMAKETKDTFVYRSKADTKFSEKWELTIEGRELSLEERFNIRYPGGKFSVFQENYPNTHYRNDPHGLLDAFNIPTKLITITYQNKKIESYE
jgi:hypothetical protein